MKKCVAVPNASIQPEYNNMMFEYIKIVYSICLYVYIDNL